MRLLGQWLEHWNVWEEVMGSTPVDLSPFGVLLQPYDIYSMGHLDIVEDSCNPLCESWHWLYGMQTKPWVRGLALAPPPTVLINNPQLK
jgi:hypothetical protein